MVIGGIHAIAVNVTAYNAISSFKWTIPGIFFVYFRFFQTNINAVLQQINVKKCPSSIWNWDLNPQNLNLQNVSLFP